MEALKALVLRGGILGIPTESSYGLAVDPHHPGGVDGLVELKGRPAHDPFPVVIGAVDQLSLCGVVVAAEISRRLEELWPAPVTVVLPLEHPIPASRGRSTLGVRVPGNPELRALLLELEMPLTATSANRSGSEPLSDPGAVEELLAGVGGVVVDHGQLPGGRPSTLVEWTGEKIRVLREGRYPRDSLRGWAGALLQEPIGAGNGGQSG